MSDLPEPLSEAEAQARVDSLRKTAQSPEAQAELAEALLRLSYALNRGGRSSEAVEAAEEGVKILSPIFLANPEKYADEMNAMVAEYLGVAQHSKRKPDMSLIKPLAGPLGRVDHFHDED
jgi:CO dehydrogenase/acetyl-CoA synthase gamma subunit (corrinoid Fe-S protein)